RSVKDASTAGRRVGGLGDAAAVSGAVGAVGVDVGGDVGRGAVGGPLGESGPAVHRHRLTRGVVYYSDCRPSADILEAARRTIAASGMPIVAVTLAPIRWPAART